MSTTHKSSTSKVIDELQSEIDDLKCELNETKEILGETKQKNSILKRRNDTLVEQLSNAKHESDMSEALLKRKQRRVLDLENQMTETISKADSLQFETDNMRKRMNTLQDKESAAVSECQRLKVSYDAIATAQAEYKKLMDRNVAELEQKIKVFLEERRQTLNDNIDLLKRQEPEIMASYKVVVKNTQRLEEMYVQKQNSVREALVTLATATRRHGQKTSIVMAECEDVLKQMNRNEEMMLRLRAEEEAEAKEERGREEEIEVEQISNLREIDQDERECSWNDSLDKENGYNHNNQKILEKNDRRKQRGKQNGDLTIRKQRVDRNGNGSRDKRNNDSRSNRNSMIPSADGAWPRMPSNPRKTSGGRRHKGRHKTSKRASRESDTSAESTTN
ncbi:hypothetical protein FOA43_000963 [Brettanomyces nanus]|uniref:SWI5-dependent HO expression protein 3 n=1 Tax=Eeniella nana TaxID=13502 RepID=A0A875RWJ4_EENNA|nr:uncharacterized protein FOA43_000963 [Brettanomyces nanus]QPG73651.1 hypothetical protein FOA43_000963 [Brettanomyces nanus]